MEKEWILLALLALIAILALVLGRSKPPAFPYQKLALFTPAEQVFLRVLQECLNPQDIMIMGKVRLADLIGPLPDLDSSVKRQAFNKICAKHIDFVLCNARNFDVVGVIELDDSSHLRTDRQARDAFVDAALEAAGIAIVHIKTQRQYDKQSIQRQLTLSLGV